MLFAAPPLWFRGIPILIGRQPYDGVAMFQVCVFLGAAAVLITWIPHVFVVDDGYLPTFAHARNTVALFWHLVAMTILCALLFGVAPFLPLADGHDLDVVVLSGKRGAPVPLWLAAPPLWATSVVLLYRTARGLWRHARVTAHR